MRTVATGRVTDFPSHRRMRSVPGGNTRCEADRPVNFVRPYRKARPATIIAPSKPIHLTTGSTLMELGIGGGILGLIIFVLDVYAIIKIVGSSASTIAKVIWVLVVLFLPVVGLIAWFIFGPKS